MNEWWCRNGDVVTLTLHVQPGASRSEISGLHGEALKIRVAAQPIEGRANDVLLRFLAGIFAVPLRNVEIQHGEQSRHKVVTISGSSINPEDLISRQ